MAFKFIVFAAFATLARAGGIGLGVAPAISYSAPIASPLSYSLPAPSYAIPQPVVQKVVAPQVYSQPIVRAPIVAPQPLFTPQVYSQPIVQAPQVYSQPIVQKVLAPQPIAYHQPLIQKVHAPVLAPQVYSQPIVQKFVAPQVYSQPIVQKTITPLIQKVHAPVVAKTIVEAPAQYDFGYSVSDPHTGDIKEQHESRNGDLVQGSYSLVEADGTRRIVEYTANALQGFNAIVHKEPASVALKAVAPVAKIATPLAYQPQGVLLH